MKVHVNIHGLAQARLTSGGLIPSKYLKLDRVAHRELKQDACINPVTQKELSATTRRMKEDTLKRREKRSAVEAYLAWPTFAPAQNRICWLHSRMLCIGKQR